MKVLETKQGKNELITEIYPSEMTFNIKEPILGSNSQDYFQANISIRIFSKYSKRVTQKNLEDVFEEILKIFD